MSDATALEQSLIESHFDEVGLERRGPIESQLITSGRSNLTYLLSDGTTKWILRRPPLGHLLETAHDMGREFAVLRALESTPVPVPRVVELCDDPSIVGATFVLMEFVDGPVLSSADDADRLTTQQARDCSLSLVDELVTLHALRPDQIGLSDFGRPAGFLARQIRRWSRQWDDSLPGESQTKVLAKLAAILTANLPPSSSDSVVHGDYRLGNVILNRAEPGRIAAIIDWEMATIGDPLADLGLLLAYWHPASAAVTAGGHVNSSNPGFVSASELIARYAKNAQLDLSGLAVYEVFGFFKLAVIAQTIVARHEMGHAVGENLDEVAGAVDALLRAGLERALSARLAD